MLGLKDKGESEDTVSVTNNILMENLKLTDIEITKAKRLGKSQKKPRPILVSCDSPSNRKAVLSTNAIYINFEQINEQQRLKDTRKHLVNHPDFKNKKVIIYQNKIHVDCQPISSDSLRAAGINQ